MCVAAIVRFDQSSRVRICSRFICSQFVLMVNLFVFEDSDVVDGKVVIRDPAKVEHLKKVLKVEVGSTIKMGMLGGMLYTGHITAIVPDVSYEVRLEAVAGSEWNPLVGSAGVCLLLGTPRPSMTKSISTVSATMGVDQIVFVKSERVDKSYFQSKTMGGPEMKKNLIHGAEQGVLRRLPETCCFPNHSLEAFLKDAWPEVEAKLKKQHPQRHIVKLIAEPRVPSNILRATCEELASVPGAEEPFFVIAIGPEGGWVKNEKKGRGEEFLTEKCRFLQKWKCSECAGFARFIVGNTFCEQRRRWWRCLLKLRW